MRKATDFLEHYNAELRQIRDAGMQFSVEHPQVAAAVGLRPGAMADPFVERLLEGTAYLSARVHRRLDQECAEFAQQALAKLSPLYMTSTPSIATFAFHPDFSSPGAYRGNMLARGTLVCAHIPNRKSPVMFSTAQDVAILPLQLAEAECTSRMDALPMQLARQLGAAPAVIRLRFELIGGLTVGELAHKDGSFPSICLSVAGDLPQAYAVHRTLLADTTSWFAVVRAGQGDEVLALPQSGMQMAGMRDSEALLPDSLDGLPGLRTLREYFSQPTRFLAVYVEVLAALAARAPGARSFELFFALRSAPRNLVGNIRPNHFRLFATPAINLYAKRFDPVPYDSGKSEQWIPVDRVRPTAYHLWSVTEVSACETSGRAHRALPALETSGYQRLDSGVRYGIRREEPRFSDGQQQNGVDPLASHDLISVSTTGDAPAPEHIATLTGRALVADRGWTPSALLDAELKLADAAPVKRIECLWPASAARERPNLGRCWEAVSHMGRNFLAQSQYPDQDATTRIAEFLYLAADESRPLDRQRLDSLRSVLLRSQLLAAGRRSPAGIVRATQVQLDISDAMHADGGAWLFGRIIAQVVSEACSLNDGLEAIIQVDGELVSRHTNTQSLDGSLR